MNIGFDAKRAFHNKTGLGNYSRSLISGLDVLYPEHNYYLFSERKKNEAFTNWIASLHHTTIVSPPANAINAWWRSMHIPKALEAYQCDVYHGLSAELPISTKPKGVKYVVTIHDLIFMRYPQLYSFINRQIYQQKTINACKFADVVIATSEQTKQDLIHYIKVPADKIQVIYQTCDPMFEIKWSTTELQAVAMKYGLPTQFILNVGTLETRKNALLILQALPQLPNEVHAVFVGKQTKYQDTLLAYIEDNGLQQRVHFISDLQFQDLPGIYQLAEVFVYPSRFEGFGIPVLEAMKCGVPVIAATGSCLEEVGGPDGLYIHPDDAAALTHTIQQLLDNPTYKSTVIDGYMQYAQNFNLARFVQETMGCYQK